MVFRLRAPVPATAVRAVLLAVLLAVLIAVLLGGCSGGTGPGGASATAEETLRILTASGAAANTATIRPADLPTADEGTVTGQVAVSLALPLDVVTTAFAGLKARQRDVPAPALAYLLREALDQTTRDVGRGGVLVRSQNRPDDPITEPWPATCASAKAALALTTDPEFVQQVSVVGNGVLSRWLVGSARQGDPRAALAVASAQYAAAQLNLDAVDVALQVYQREASGTLHLLMLQSLTCPV